MFEARTRRSRIGLQVLATLLVLPFLAPLVAMVQGSLAGQGVGNYRKVFHTGVVGTYFRNSILIAVSTIALVYVCTMLAASGRITAISWSYRSKVDAVTNSGVSSTASGIVSATRSIQNQISLPAIRSFEKPKAASIVHT